jgi:hypothetical protein
VHTSKHVAGGCAMVRGMGEPFVGSEALKAGIVNRHQLRTHYRLLCPDVYLHKQIQPSLQQRIAAAWLWSARRAIIAGAAAAALHGAKWIDDDIAIELIYPNARAAGRGDPPRRVARRRGADLDGPSRDHGRADRLRHRPAWTDPLGGCPTGFACSGDAFLGRRRRATCRPSSPCPRTAPTGNRARSGRPGRGVAEGKLSAATSHRRWFTPAADPDTRRDSGEDVVPRHGLGRVHGRGRIPWDDWVGW